MRAPKALSRLHRYTGSSDPSPLAGVIRCVFKGSMNVGLNSKISQGVFKSLNLRILTNSEDQAEMPHKAVFDQGVHYLLNKIELRE